MKRGLVYYKGILAGELYEKESSYYFQYDEIYLKKEDAKAISLTLPLKIEVYESKQILFPFFDGLIPEGWLLNIATSNWKINKNDRFALLLALCRDCIGCVSIIPKKEDYE